MKEFRYTRAATVDEAVTAATTTPEPSVRYLAGGTNLIDLMREGVEQPDRVVDISRLALADIDELPDGGLRFGAVARNSRIARDERVRRRYPMVAQAILNGASPQLRNKATVGGNLLQRTRCGYFYDTTAACNKRMPGAGCDALHGFNRMHAILGASDSCIAVHPSDLCVALAALDAVVQLRGADGVQRAVPLTEFHRLPGETPHVETVLAPGELVTAVDLPPAPQGRMTYVKVRDRASFAFALISVAVVLDTQEGRVRAARIALGGVAHKPWRAFQAEENLIGAPAEDQTFRHAAGEALASARPYQHNAFKPELARRLIHRTLVELASGEEGQSR
ncbi:FAD binding domain-containing protein [Mycobacterium hubeiense]|uniref:FAD binding domain-containing protein n=1 Tax=Mycobacterium hubeiense TaxID=1867256 RepID=UPI000C7F00D2|nr:xanthine dehydrogenase family protein subunit M [Mycobacterium sp. QGD 101]